MQIALSRPDLTRISGKTDIITSIEAVWRTAVGGRHAKYKTTCGAAHEMMGACGPMSVRRTREHYEMEPVRDNGGAESTHYMDGLTCWAIGKACS